MKVAHKAEAFSSSHATQAPDINIPNDRWAQTLSLSSTYPDHYLKREVPYEVTRTPWGLAMMYLAGLISGLLGIGSGTFKVLAMDSIISRLYL